jgi:hypothetical protein
MSTPATATLAVIAIPTEIAITATATTNERSFPVKLNDLVRQTIVGTSAICCQPAAWISWIEDPITAKGDRGAKITAAVAPAEAPVTVPEAAGVGTAPKDGPPPLCRFPQVCTLYSTLYSLSLKLPLFEMVTTQKFIKEKN